jgi:alpha-beta hydrolase superfamily lysophospholipase
MGRIVPLSSEKHPTIETVVCPGEPRQVVLLGHGLNNSPRVLDALADLVETRHACLVKLTFSGHGYGPKNTVAGWEDCWISEMRAAMEEARRLSEYYRVPLCFVGFSLSCVVFLNAQPPSGITFRRVVFIAPPLAMDIRYRLLELLGALFLRFVPSFSDRKYRARSFLPVSMYRALFSLIRKINQAENFLNSVPALVFLVSNDELVSTTNVTRWLRRKNVCWPIVPLATGRHLCFVETTPETNLKKLIAGAVKAWICHGRFSEAAIAITPYEHFFLNEENEQYPISIVIKVTVRGKFERSLFEASLVNAQWSHPLLRSKINGFGFERRATLRWIVLKQNFAPYVDWVDRGEVFTFPNGRREINLRDEVGVRAFVRAGAEKSEVTFQFHHACVDGYGAAQFVRSVLAGYDPSQYSPRAGSLTYLNQRIASKSPSYKQLSALNRFRTFRARPIAARTAGSSSVGLLDLVVHRTLKAPLYRRLSEVSQVTGNDVWVMALAQTIGQWNREAGEPENIRITLPVDLRRGAHRRVSAANVAGMYFVDFDARRKKTLIELHGELMKMKRFGLARAFTFFIAGLGNVSRAIKFFNRPPRDGRFCQTSTCLSNLGPVDGWFPPNAALECTDAFGVAPLRPGSRMTVSVAVRKNALTFTLLADPLYFSVADAEDFASRLEHQICETLSEAESKCK